MGETQIDYGNRWTDTYVLGNTRASERIKFTSYLKLLLFLCALFSNAKNNVLMVLKGLILLDKDGIFKSFCFILEMNFFRITHLTCHNFILDKGIIHQPQSIF